MAKFQIKGVDNIISAYDSRGADCWSLWQDKQFITTGCGSEELQTFLDIISGGDTRIVYTLKIYDGITNSKEITDKTPCNGSFNFSLGLSYIKDPEKENYDSKRFREIEEKIGALAENLNPPEPEESWKDIFVGFLKEPDALIKLINAGKMILGINPGPQSAGYSQQPAMGAIGNINESMTRPTFTPEQTQARINRLAAAIETLDKNDPGLVEHIEKLAEISVKSPGQFSFLVKALESF